MNERYILHFYGSCLFFNFAVPRKMTVEAVQVFGRKVKITIDFDPMIEDSGNMIEPLYSFDLA